MRDWIALQDNLGHSIFIHASRQCVVGIHVRSVEMLVVGVLLLFNLIQTTWIWSSLLLMVIQILVKDIVGRLKVTVDQSRDTESYTDEHMLMDENDFLTENKITDYKL